MCADRQIEVLYSIVGVLYQVIVKRETEEREEGGGVWKQLSALD